MTQYATPREHLDATRQAVSAAEDAFVRRASTAWSGSGAACSSGSAAEPEPGRDAGSRRDGIVRASAVVGLAGVAPT